MTVVCWSLVVAFVVLAMGMLPRRKRVTLEVAMAVRRGTKGRIRLFTLPVGSQIDLKDVPLKATSSEPESMEASIDGNYVNLRALKTGTAAGADVLVEADKDQDAGEVQIISKSFHFDITDAVVEPDSIEGEVEPFVDDVAEAAPSEPAPES